MNTDQLEKLRQTFCQTLNLPATTDSEALQRSSIRTWDSLAQVSVVSAIEMEFDVLFEPEEFARITSFEAAVQFLKSKGIL